MTYQWINLGNGREVLRRVRAPVESKRSDLAMPMFVRDDMNEIEHPCDGKSYSSKSAFRAVTKAHGCVEVGNDASRFNVPEKAKPDRQAIRASLQKAKARVSA